MGTIISSRIREDGKVVYEVVIDSDESLQLKGHMNDIHVFSLNNAHSNSRLSRRGKNDATTYFLLPKDMRAGLKESAPAKCQMLQMTNKKVFVFTVDDF
jgi:hypothetical protein